MLTVAARGARTALLVAALAAPAVAAPARPPAAAPAPATPVTSTPARTPAEALWTDGRPASRRGPALGAPPSFANLARALGPAVVNISTVIQGGAPPGAADVPGPPGSAPSRPPRGRGQGTGFIIHPSGLILTNNHVVDNSDQIRVRLADERELSARVVGRDERTDIALIRIDGGAPLPVAPLGDSDRVEIGEWVIAIGNPFGLDHTVTAGIVSAKGRRDVRPGGQTSGFYDFIQTDASINAGNSGGPLINTRGEVIGINTAMNAQAQGIAFAIPINMAKAIIPSLSRTGAAPRSWLGLYPQSITPLLQRAFHLDDTRGALIADVVPASPAAAAGLEAGDVVLDFDGHPIRRADDLEWLVAIAGAGRPVPMTTLHKGARRQIAVTLAWAPGSSPPPPPVAAAPAHQSSLGMTVSEITVGIARELGQAGLRGLVVMAVEPESPASEAGVERGDVLLRVGDRVVLTTEDYVRAMRDVARGQMIRLLARREGRNLWLAFPKR